MNMPRMIPKGFKLKRALMNAAIPWPMALAEMQTRDRLAMESLAKRKQERDELRQKMIADDVAAKVKEIKGQ